MIDTWTLSKVGGTTKEGKSFWTFGFIKRGFAFRPAHNDNPEPPRYA